MEVGKAGPRGTLYPRKGLRLTGCLVAMFRRRTVPTNGDLAMFPVPDRPVLYVADGGGTIIAGDIHVGLSRREAQDSTLGSGSAKELAEALLESLRQCHARRIILLGDVKEPIVGAPLHVRRELKEFFGRLSLSKAEVWIARGNHDVGLERFVPPEVKIRPSRGWLESGIGYLHGHAKPTQEVLSGARKLVMAHLHPGLRFAEGRQRCWIRVRYAPGQVPGAPFLEEAVVVPAFNPLCSAESLNFERPRRNRRFLVRQFLSQGVAQAYLLDGTDLGRMTF